jgi:ribonuclease PH
MNVVMTGGGGLVEIQGTAERAPFSRRELDAMLALAEQGIGQLLAAQRAALGS